MKFNLRKIFSRKNEKTRVLKVRVMPGNGSRRSRDFTPPEVAITRPTTPPEVAVTISNTPPEEVVTRTNTPPKVAVTRSTTPPEQEVTEVVQPPSPTCVKEQIFHEETFSGEEKDANDTTEWHTAITSFTCQQSPHNTSSKEDELKCSEDSAAPSETMKRLKEMRRIVYEKFEGMNREYYDYSIFHNIIPNGDIGESAMTAVAKNREEMNQMLGKFDTVAGMGDPMHWFLDTESADEENDDGPLFQCDDMKTCLQTSGNSLKERTSGIVPASCANGQI